MSRSHNKKRNVGIIYEQLLSTISRALVEKNQSKANKALSIVRSHFSPGSELYKEFRLFNALMKTYVKSDALASRIISESKSAAVDHDTKILDKEKSKLIKEINYTLGKDEFYQTPVKEYKILATIQSLLNDWRKPSYDVTRRVTYETKIHEWLTTEKNIPIIAEMKTPDVNDLTVKIMRETFNKKFAGNLNENQKALIKCLVFEGDLDESSRGEITEMMTSQRDNAVNLLKEYKTSCESTHVKGKIPKVLDLLESLDASNTSDANIVKCLSVTRLCDELMETGNE
jgi:hypothetical protein